MLKAGSSSAIEIPFSGSPQPQVTWKYKGGKLPDTRRFREETIRNMTSLTMSKVLKTDCGEYSVSLENPFGRNILSIKLVVLGKCDMTITYMHTHARTYARTRAPSPPTHTYYKYIIILYIIIYMCAIYIIFFRYFKILCVK